MINCIIFLFISWFVIANVLYLAYFIGKMVALLMLKIIDLAARIPDGNTNDQAPKHSWHHQAIRSYKKTYAISSQPDSVSGDISSHR